MSKTKKQAEASKSKVAGSEIKNASWNPEGGGMLGGRKDFGPLFLLTVPPIFIILMWHTNYNLDGSLPQMLQELIASGPSYVYNIWPTPWNPLAWKIIFGYMAVELLLMRFVPGPEFRAMKTAMGNVPIYTDNGVMCYLISIGLLALCTYFGVFVPGDIYDLMGNLLASINVFALLFCIFLTIKGYYFPSTSDNGPNGSLILDIYWGTELYPRIFGWDVKVFTNCRFGMMFWALGIISFAHKQYLDIGYVSSTMTICVALQLIYITKFYIWETGYFCSMDIQHDRAGYYLCWGCMAFLPCIYTSHTYYLVKHPIDLSLGTAAVLFILGALSIWANYDADRQRQHFRATDGKCSIWGQPPKVVKAKYITGDGREQTSLLLASGWWGLSRHWHYIPEILASVFWSQCLVTGSLMSWFYAIYLTLLLTDRAFRDDERCKGKYGKYWAEYCQIVPAKIIPGII